MKTFLKDPKNLRYSLNTIIPVVVFLTSILVAVTTERFHSDSGSGYIWILTVSLFASICSLFVVIGVTQPLKELLARAEHLVRFRGKKSERGQMIEVYQLIENLMELVKSENTGKNEKATSPIEGIERLDYLLPLGYMSLMVAHEVRNPLSTITGMSELLKQKEKGPENKKYIDAILEAAKKIDVFTKELLDFTDDEIEQNEIDINSLVEDVILVVSKEFKGVAYEFKRGNLIPFVGDSNKLYQAVHNIIKNAFEYENMPGGFVGVKTNFSDWITISVYNKHSSIDENDLGSIFKPFFTRKRGGKGLGLFIAMRNVKLHGGDISAESGEKGTEFEIKLPGGNI